MAKLSLSRLGTSASGGLESVWAQTKREDCGGGTSLDKKHRKDQRSTQKGEKGGEGLKKEPI